jgi:hypothetical protein
VHGRLRGTADSLVVLALHMRAAMKLTTFMFTALMFTTAGCIDDEAAAPLLTGDEVEQTQLDATDAPLEAEADEAIETPTEEIVSGLDLEDPDMALDDDTQTIADTIGPAYHLFTKVGATCRDHCVANDQYIGSYRVTFSSPFYHYNNSRIFSDYYVGASRKQIWEQHRFKAARVDLFCGSSGQYLRKYYGRAKRGRDVVRTWICFAGRCRFQGDNVLSMHKGWKH